VKTVLITGAAGMIGQVLMSRLADTYELGGLDIRPAEGIDTVSVADFGGLLTSFGGVDVVVHLGAMVSPDSSWDDVLEYNIIGTRNVYEAAKVQGVQRVVFASSHQSMRLYENDEPYVSVLAGRISPQSVPPITIDMPFRPSGFYGASKAFGEILGRVYAEHYGLSVLCIRIVQVNKENRPHGPRWFSHDDVEQMVRCCIEAKDIKFGVYYGVSGNSHAVWDLSNSQRDLGYRPKDRHEMSCPPE
jgi:nucleoside-diphosphate-sugar epimerase